MSVDSILVWVTRLVAAAGAVVVGWACLTAWPAIVHGHPAYGLLLVVTVAAAAAAGAATVVRTRHRRRPTGIGWWRALLCGVLLALAGGWLAAVAFLRPFPAQQPALAAMTSDGAVLVRESATEISLTPRGTADSPGVFFHPGARVDARAYAALLRPLAASGHLVVIAKQPLGVAFLATGAFGSARATHPQVSTWVVGGHSLGGVVAASDAAAHDTDSAGRISGLVLYASYPGSDLSGALTCPVLSVSGSADGLATPDTVARTKVRLPAGTRVVVVEGAVHAFFGDYGPQGGDGTPAVSRDEARRRIVAATTTFLDTAG